MQQTSKVGKLKRTRNVGTTQHSDTLGCLHLGHSSNIHFIWFTVVMFEVIIQNFAHDYKILFLILRPVVILLCWNYQYVYVDFVKFIRHTEIQIPIQSTSFEIIELETVSCAQLVGILIFIYKTIFISLYLINKY